jgi:hypothetical protein
MSPITLLSPTLSTNKKSGLNDRLLARTDVDVIVLVSDTSEPTVETNESNNHSDIPEDNELR